MKFILSYFEIFILFFFVINRKLLFVINGIILVLKFQYVLFLFYKLHIFIIIYKKKTMLSGDCLIGGKSESSLTNARGIAKVGAVLLQRPPDQIQRSTDDDGVVRCGLEICARLSENDAGITSPIAVRVKPSRRCCHVRLSYGNQHIDTLRAMQLVGDEMSVINVGTTTARDDEWRLQLLDERGEPCIQATRGLIEVSFNFKFFFFSFIIV